jgi:iron complex transport system permease protein
VSLYTGNSSIDAPITTRILAGDYSRATPFEVFTVLDVRLPRLLCALVAGFALGVSGALFQELTENPLGSPDIIGFTGGAATGAVMVIVSGGGALVGTAAGALVGGLVTAAVIYLLAWRAGLDGYRLILVGIGVTAVLGAARTYVLSRADLEQATAGLRWLSGSLTGRGWGDVAVAAIGFMVLASATAPLHRAVSRLSAGPDLATSQGLNVGRTRVLIALVGTAWVAVAVVVAGPISFVALAAPHIARSLSRASGVPLFSAGMVGAVLLVVADLVALRVLSPTQLPTGVVTAVLGGVYLLWLLQRLRRGAS